MKFKKYPEIENHYREKYIAILEEHGFANIAYIAHEKIHGCNFSFWTDGNEVQVASRGDWVDGTFYACQAVIDRYRGDILHLKNEYYPEFDQIGVYGELYGPGIMKGVYYSERKDFRAFEIRVNEHDIVKPMTAKYHFAKCDIPQAPFVGIYKNLAEALKENNVFDSKVCKLDEKERGLVAFCEYEEGENNAEGLVIQPLEGALYTGNGARVMIKSKNPKFIEKNKPKKNKEETPPNLFIPVAALYVNENRMNAVLSKFPEATQKDFGKIIGAMNKDVIKDMIKDGDLPERWKKHEVYKPAGKGVSTVVSAFLKEHLLKEL